MNTVQKNLLPRKKRLLIVLSAALLLALLPFGISAFVCASVQDRILTPDDAASLSADAILVLGARVWDNGNPSGILEDRLITGILAYEAGASNRLLMSGDHGQDEYDEVNVMKNYAMAQGIPSENIFMDHAGFSTYESLYRARDVFAVQSVVIVTQRYHLYRALYVARALGLDAYGVSADRRDYNSYWLFDVRETFARCKDFVYSIFQPLPTYLGDVIPITGDASATDG